MGSVGGGGGARPSAPNMSRPSGPNMSRPSAPNMSRPNTPNMSRPSPPNASRPSLGNVNARPPATNLGGMPGGRPSPGASRPSLGGAGSPPNINLPTTRPANPSIGARPSLPNPSNRPAIKPPSAQIPSTRPSTGIGENRPAIPGGNNRPSLGNVNRPTTLPGNASRPNIGGERPNTLPGTINRPNLGGERPSTLPGTVERPNIGGGRPNIGGERPTTLPGNIDRPVIGGNRPNINLPNAGNNLGNNVGNNLVNRPSIGGNRPGFGNDTNINLGNNSNNINIGNNNIGNNNVNRFPNRPNWDVDPGFSRPGWGLNGGGNWNSNWHNNSIHHHHHWYNGCWHGRWGSSWYAPVLWGGIGWGLGSMTNNWGYNYASFYNPYYADPLIAQAIPYDYSQPVVINNIVSSTAEAESEPLPEEQAQEQALAMFDEGLSNFTAGQYAAALNDLNSALKELPEDPVVHEVRALTLFALGDYKAAAAGLNSLLSAAPGMDWTTMSGLYGDPDDYAAQLRKLEKFCNSNPTDAAAHFVLAYHYLVTDSEDGAIKALKVVVANQPKDITAQRMLEAMAPTQTAAVGSQAPAATTTAADDANASETDLVGKWLAKSGETKIELSITEESQFTWTAESGAQPPIVLTGQLAASSDGISLETEEQGAIGGSVVSKGPDKWTFSITGAPPSDPGLSFTRLN